MISRIRSISRVRFIYVVTTLFLVGLSIFSYYQINNLFTTAQLLLHTNQVKDNLNHISAKLFEAESNKRGYLLSGDASRLQKRDAAMRSIAQDRLLLDSLAMNNALQMHHLRVLDTVLNEKIQSINSITAEPDFDILPSSLMFSIGEGNIKMDAVSAHLDRMIREEDDFLDQRTRIFARLSLLAPLYIIVLFLGALLILFYSYFRLSAELLQSQKLQAAMIKQGHDRENLAAELIQANRELAFQNEEKEMRASELAVANLELGFQNETKAKLADELIVANHELAFQNEEKEKRAAELVKANKELQLFLNISSHDLQEPLRKIQMSASRMTDEDIQGLTSKGRDHFVKMQEAARSMQTLIEDLLTYARTNTEERIFESTDIVSLMEEVCEELKEAVDEKEATIELPDAGYIANVIPFQFKQLLHNIITNALKFSIPGSPPHIRITCGVLKGSEVPAVCLMRDHAYHHITISDNGIGFDPIYGEKIFEVFQRLYGRETYKGTGIGLAIVKRIVENHKGVITATGQLSNGACFDIYIPITKNDQNG